MHAPEHHVTREEKRESSRADVDLSHLDTASIKTAVTPQQRALVETALDWHRTFDEWPEARELAFAAEVSRPAAWADLKVLARLGLVAWGKTVSVLRAPDGVFLAVGRVPL